MEYQCHLPLLQRVYFSQLSGRYPRPKRACMQHRWTTTSAIIMLLLYLVSTYKQVTLTIQLSSSAASHLYYYKHTSLYLQLCTAQRSHRIALKLPPPHPTLHTSNNTHTSAACATSAVQCMHWKGTSRDQLTLMKPSTTIQQGCFSAATTPQLPPPH